MRKNSTATKPELERKLIRIFGKVYSPINFTIFTGGALWTLYSLVKFILSDFDSDWTRSAFDGLILSVAGYAEVKEDEVKPSDKK